MSLAFVLIVFVAANLAVVLFLLLRARRRGPVGGIGPERDEQESAFKNPYFRREVVEAKVKSLFPDDDPAELLRLLDGLVPSFWGLERLQLAALKLSKGDAERLRRYVDTPERELIDLIGSAEYPYAWRIGFLNCVELPTPLQELIYNRDLRQYLRWLKRG
ncbi:MAG TPA: hypothetical protein VFX96_10355 [Pyrinomonadaceae bacterium]|nr:hypothetical protein [Pyrinomonadaceae bacterium]